MTEIWTITEVAEKYRFSERWVRDFCRARNIPVLRSKSKIRFDEIAINAFEQELRAPCRTLLSPSEKIAPAPFKSPERFPGIGGYDEMLRRKRERASAKGRRESSPSPKPPSSKPTCSSKQSTAPTQTVVAIGSLPTSPRNT
jgi:hypothetical protein